MLRRVRQSLRQVLFLMARRPGLLCGAILLGVLLVLAVKFTCSRAKNVVAAARPPVRFFSSEAPVVDFYFGQLDQVDRIRSMAEVSLIFFYAPWCAHSMAARQELQQVAKRLAKQVRFLAVNCWWNQGKCRKQYRFFHFPIIHMFYRRFGPIEYRGPIVAPYVESFILRVITPLIYLPSPSSLKEFLSYHEPRVVGFFQFNSSPQPPGYITYLSSALQALRRDFQGVVRFGVVTNKHVAEAISLQDESVYLHRRFNRSLIFPRRELNFTSEAICRWVFEHSETVLRWLQPPGTKSHLLEQELTKGPALLLFLPHNPLGSGPSPLLQQVADVAVRYHSCDNTDRLSSDDGAASRSLCCQSVPLPDSSTRMCEVCLKTSPTIPGSSSSCCWFPSVAQEGDVLQPYVRDCCLKRESASASVNNSTLSSCGNFLSNYSPFGQYSACCRQKRPHLDESHADTREVPLPPSSGAQQREDDSITGLQCQTNRTLRFYLLDVALNWALAVRLGAGGNASAPLHQNAGSNDDRSGDGSFATIVNLKDEVHYVLHRSPAATLTESLETFIRNFSAPYSLLHRHLVGEEVRKGVEEETRHEDDRQQSPPPRLLVTEVTTSSFLPIVMDIHKDVLLFYYTQWCGFCSVLNHIILQLARLLQANGTVTVARVNVARNDLPWEFMVDHVPSILLFPKYRKHFSVKFPDQLPITLPNLLRFILQHAGSVQYTDKPVPAETEAPGPGAVFRAEFLELQHEVQTLRQARERLSQQLAQLWRDNRRLNFDARILEAQNAELRQERQNLEEQHREKSRQLGEAVRRLQELADASEDLLNENTLLRALLVALKDRAETKDQAEAELQVEEEERSHMAS
ncbi:thioredoxin domain-containing protein 11 isoform X1 [Antennarius striatus]|uniref:thioredoxin domain-containing protein 11 isoform X1 n=1 Tax=Antennarius striatus TaxID=241820 RepID=UPI0035B08502